MNLTYHYKKLNFCNLPQRISYLCSLYLILWKVFFIKGNNDDPMDFIGIISSSSRKKKKIKHTILGLDINSVIDCFHEEY